MALFTGARQNEAGLYTATREGFSSLALEGDASGFTGVSGVSINNAGQIALHAHHPTISGSGIFLGLNAEQDKAAAPGDPVTVDGVAWQIISIEDIGPHSLDGSGRVVFMATIRNPATTEVQAGVFLAARWPTPTLP